LELRGKVALVTGAAHRVGRAIALALAREGAGIVLHYGRSRAAAEATAQELVRLGVPVWPHEADLAEPAAIEGLLAHVAATAGRLDVLVNSAASFERQPFEQITAEAWDRVLAVNLRAPFLLMRAAAPLLRASERAPDEAALVVNILDLAGELPWPGYAHHGVSKAGLGHLTRIAARELGPAIRVNAVVPGAVLPPPGMTSDGPAWHQIGARLPVGQTGSPDAIGQAVVFLAHQEFMTGAAVPVDGGEHLLGAGHR
jgi:pteridine reductase